MSNEKPKATVPAEMPPEAPAELLGKRDRILTELEKTAKASTGTLQAVLRKMAALINNTKPGAQPDGQLYQDVKDAFQRFSTDPAAAKSPAILMESVEWMQQYLAARGFAIPGDQTAPGATGAAPQPAARTAGGAKDGFEGSSAPRNRSLTGEDVPPPPAKPADPKEQQQQLESFKNWMKNPGIGKVKG